MRLALTLAALLAAAPALASDWDAVLAQARGQTVWFNAWGGDQRTNDFLDWIGEEAEARYGVTVEHVKLSDTGEAVARVLAEKQAGKTDDGAIDLIWINGPNFAAMKAQDLLFGPFAAKLPNARYVNMTPGAPAAEDFTLPTEGYESPWRLAKFVLTYDSARVENPPQDMIGLARWAQLHPGRFTHPDPSNFIGATFLKQALLELAPDQINLRDAPDDETYVQATAPLWDWYETLRPSLWRGGEAFPATAPEQQQLLNDGAVDFSMDFDPGVAANAIAQGLLPETARAYALRGGTIGNVSFVAIPFNAAHKAGAQVVANLLLDPQAQARAQNVEVLGAYSVLDPTRLDADARAAFDALPGSPALPTLEALGPTLPEPHPGWMTRLSADWAERYAR